MRRGTEARRRQKRFPFDFGESRSTMETVKNLMPTYSRLQKPVLVLNASYEPINICAARRALVLVLKGVASAEEVTSHNVHSSRRTVPLPTVIRLLEYRRIPHQTRSLSRKNLLMRDRYT